MKLKIRMFDLKFKIKNLKLLKLGISFLIFAAIAGLAMLWLTHPALAGWWPDGGTAWLNRKQLTLTNNSGGNLNANAVVTVTLDTQSLYTLGKLKSDCSDLRIVYNPNSTTYKEINRYVGFASGVTCTTSNSSKVSFALQAAVSNAASSTDYYLYYNNPDATAPTNNQTAFSVGSSTATFVCPFDGSSTCLAAGTATPTTETGAIRYAGSKSALSFDGVSDYVTTGNIGSDIKTVEFWVYPTSTTNYFVDLNGSAYISASAGTLSATGFTSPVYYVNGVATTTITANTWQHIAVTTTTAINASSTNVGKIASTYLAGYMDELRISNSVRYSAAFTTTTAPFVRDSNTKLLYHFDENGDDPRQTGKTIDDSGNGYHGTITGAKYVAGLVGVDASTTNTGNVPRQSYASHEGVFIEEATTNKITNPSFENATYDTNWTGAATAQILTLQPDGTTGIDTYTKQGSPDTNFGTNALMETRGFDVFGVLRHSFVKFDLSSIPSTATVNSATLSLYHNNTGATGPFDQRVRRVLPANSAWTETGATFNYAVASTTRWAGDTGNDGGNDAGGSVSGTDYSSTAMGTFSYYGPNANGYEYAISLSTAEFDLMRTNNIGFVITGESGAGVGELYTSDDTTAANRPKLVVNYTPTFTVTQNTTAPYYKFGSNSAKIVASDGNGSLVTSINPGNTNTHMLSAYVYDGTSGNVGGTVGATVAKLVYRGTAQTTTYTDMGGGWWRLSYSAAAANAAENYGVQVLSGKTVYIDGVQLEALAYATTYTDGTLGTGYAWTGTANNSTSTRTAADMRYSSNNISNTKGTVSFWVKPSINLSQGIADNFTLMDVVGSGGGNNGRMLLNYSAIHGGGGLTIWDNAGGGRYCNKTPTWTPGNWIHLVFTWDNTSGMTCYVDNSAGTPNSSSWTMPTIGSSLFIGQSLGASDQANVSLSDFRIYNTALTANDVSDLYYAGLVGHSENIVLDRFGGGDTKGQDPLAVWHMDEGYGTTVNDSSRNTKPLTSSGATWESGIGNTRSARARYLKFDGSTSYLSRAQDSGFDFGTGSFSISGWFHHPSTAPASGTHTILARYGSAGFKMYMNTSGYVCFGIDADSTWSPADTACSGASDGSLADSKWHHVEAVKNGTTSISLYIDGHLAQTTTVTATGSMNTASALYFGVDSTGNSNYWNGWLDEFMVYPYARSAAQVKTDLLDPVSVLIGSSPNDPLSNGLVGYWKMDEASWTNDCTATSVTDSSGNGNNGKACPNSTGPTGGAVGKFGNGGSFDGSNDYVDMGVVPPALLLNRNFTLSAWIYRTAANTNTIISAGSNNYQLRVGSTNLLTLLDDNIANIVSGNTSMALNTWYHVAATIGRESTAPVNLYVNGVLDGSTTTTNVFNDGSGSTNFLIGAEYPGNQLFQGSIDETRVYNRALSPKEVRDLYNWAPGPAAYLNMDEGSGTSANDSSGNSRTGTLNDGPVWNAGKYGKGVKLDGSNDDVSVGDFGY